MIRIESVTKRYPDGTVAVDDLTLDIPDGSVTVLVGPSGCGKTTTLRMINRMVEPTAGRILLDGRDIQDRPVTALRRSMGYVIQNAGLFQHRTIVDNIATVPRMLGWDKARARERAVDLMRRVGLDAGLAKRYPYQLSGGQQQRVGVARALAADPPVLLMDEPFSAVDPVVRKGLQAELLRLQEELGKTIVFVTHDIDEAIKLGTMVAVMREGGRLAQFAPPDELLSAPADAFVEDFLGTDRGIRRLSFFTSAGLEVTAAPVVALGAGEGEAEAEVAHEDEGGTDTGPLKKPAAAAGSQAAAPQKAAPQKAAPQKAAPDDPAPGDAGPAAAPYLLLTDGDGRPLGWATPEQAALARESGRAPAELLPCGRPFVLGKDSLRDALDCAVLSPTGWAVAVDGTGRVVGVAAQETVADAIRGAHAEHGAKRKPDGEATAAAGEAGVPAGSGDTAAPAEAVS